MASRAGEVRRAPGAAAIAALVVTLTLGMAVVVGKGAGSLRPTPADWSALRFTVLQAGLSASLSCLLAVPVARALARRRFAGRGLLISLMGAPFLLPVIVAVLGLLAVFGRGGLVNDALSLTGLPRLSVYGLHGVVLAHVFLNLPLATRMLLMGWQAIPAERFRLAASLGMPQGAMFRHLEVPMLRAVLPGAAVVIFTICLASFAVALTLGGGPGATTVELAIYQALRFDYDPARAATLALIQFALGAGAVALGWVALTSAGFGAGLGRQMDLAAPKGWRRAVDALAITLAAAFLLLPLGAVVVRGVPGLSDLPQGLGMALLRSISVALASTVVTSGAALILSLAVARRASGARLFDAVAVLPLAVSGLVLGTGLFLTLRSLVRPEDIALPVTVLVNALLSLPYAYRLLLPEARALCADYGRLSDSLALRGVARLRWITLPRLARPLGFGAGVAAALSMGDLGVITLFAGESGATLPLYVHRLMGAYRMEAAAGAALVLVAASFALFALFDGIGRRAAP
ncbi:thiamine/thiamine pyrophosphate ABC transporter permease ThiP [Paragemmobacter straminiformis]|uniref:Thiamine/thiamine pyrophosphate ABC transporter permease ThiP n=1 Tax=Paragemmobacter straminiformis TaxID=2045119 RepID=A0A842I6A5_9RHOB|nr:thiamine/thiamine pyrophosphate ABC transporter permease ThiP [Gemmobacter straminiformis]MBC2834943.1 thiamine/thiamine pyrophosphate ABC transporter permease ThiP [Gemmobacter straminiformis]